MKKTAFMLLLFLPITSFAQNYQGMSEQNMQIMMQQMQEVETCMQKLDQAKMKALEERSRQFEAEINALCASGKRDEAQSKAIAYGKELAKDPTMQAMHKCSAKMKGAMPEMPYTDQQKDRSSHHVCD